LLPACPFVLLLYCIWLLPPAAPADQAALLLPSVTLSPQLLLLLLPCCWSPAASAAVL
jgi:hypothetical protein